VAEKLLLVCDVCGNPAVETVTFKTSSGNRQKDFCATHLQELLRGSRTPKPGRRPGSRSTAATTSAKKTTTRKRSTRKKSTGRKKTVARKKTSRKPGYSKNGKRLGRPPGSTGKARSARKATSTTP
jgi:hypothetical protein